MRRVAYIRISTAEQRPDRQIDGLKDMADELHIETLSAVARTRPVYETVKALLEPGDMLVIWALDRAYRSAKDALIELDALRDRGIHLHIANLHLDTRTPHGRFAYIMMSGLAEFERELMIERTKEGIAAARARGKRIGRPPKLTPDQLRRAHWRIAEGAATCAEIAAEYKVWPWSLTRALRRLTMH